MYPPLCGDGVERCTPLHHLTTGRPYPPKRSAPQRGDSGVSAALWGRGGALHPPALGIPVPRTGKPRTGGGGGARVHPPLRGDGGERCTSLHHPPSGKPYPPKRSATDRGDSGVSATVWGRGGGGVVPPCTTLLLGVPIPLNGLQQTGGTRVHPPQCGDGGERGTPPCTTFAPGARIPQHRLHKTAGTRLYPPQCGDGGERCTPLHHPPTGRPLPQKRSARDRGAQVYPPLRGDGEERGIPLHHPPTSYPYPPKRSTPHRGGWTVSAAVQGRGGGVVTPYTTLQLGVTIPQNGLRQTRGTRVYLPLCGDGGKGCNPLAPPFHPVSLSPKSVYTTPVGLGCIRRYVGTGGSVVPPYTTLPLGFPIPVNVCRKPGGLGCIRRYVGIGGSVVPPCTTFSRGVPIPQNGLPQIRGTWVHPPLCGDGGSVVVPCTTLPVGVPIPHNGRHQTKGTRVYPPLRRDGEERRTLLHHLSIGRPYPPKRSAANWGNSGVSAAVGDGVEHGIPVHHLPTHGTIPQKVLAHNGGNRVYPPLCGDGGGERCTHLQHLSIGRPYPPKRCAPNWRESGVSAAVWGRGGERCTHLQHLSIGRPYPPKRSTPNWRESGVSAAVWGRGELCTSLATPFHRVSLSPKMVSNKPGRLWCGRRSVGSGGKRCTPCMTVPVGVPIPQNGLPRTGGAQVYPPMCGDGRERCTPLHNHPTGRPYPPKRSAPDPGDSGVSPALWGHGGALYPPAPLSHGTSLYPKNVCRRPGGLGCIRRCVQTGGSGVPLCTTFPLGGRIPQNGMHHSGGTRVYPPLCGDRGEHCTPLH